MCERVGGLAGGNTGVEPPDSEGAKGTCGEGKCDRVRDGWSKGGFLDCLINRQSTHKMKTKEWNITLEQC